MGIFCYAKYPVPERKTSQRKIISFKRKVPEIKTKVSMYPYKVEGNGVYREENHLKPDGTQSVGMERLGSMYNFTTLHGTGGKKEQQGTRPARKLHSLATR
jgi:hypothetical protein